MRIAFALLLAIHGAIHALGFVKGFGLAEVVSLKEPVGPHAGVLWLAAGLGFLAAAGMFLAAPARWWIVGLPALALSQALIASSWTDARFGTLVNVIVLIPLALGMLEASPGSFSSMYQRESRRHLALLPAAAPDVTEADLAPLPPLVQVWLRRAGVVGKPRVLGFRARFHGRFRQGFDSPWMRFTSEQHNFVQPSARLFLMRASLFGLPLDGYHDFVGSEARFRVRALSLAQVVDGKGPAMNQSETVTLFNDLCVLAPAALVDLPVRWTIIDDLSVRGAFTRGDQTISAVLVFDGHGDLVDFISEDRYFSADGKTVEKLPWRTPLHDPRDFGGVRLPARGDATWRTPKGDFVYGEFTLDEVAYFPPGDRPAGDSR